jgi:hypothetical protein
MLTRSRARSADPTLPPAVAATSPDDPRFAEFVLGDSALPVPSMPLNIQPATTTTTTNAMIVEVENILFIEFSVVLGWRYGQ